MSLSHHQPHYWWWWCYNHVAHIISSSTALAFLTSMSEKCKKSASSSTVQVQSGWKTIGIEEKLYIINQLEKCEWIVDICCNVRLAHSSARAICDNADRNKESAKSGTKVFKEQNYHIPFGMNDTKNCGCGSLIFLLQ